jgi:hypothetical protein
MSAISKACPKCGNAEYTEHRPERLVAFAKDRVCQSCGSRYSPPTPVWAAVVFILIGLPLAAFGAFSLFVRITSGNLLGIPALLIEGFLGLVGAAAIIHGIRVLMHPGKM